MDLLFSCFRGAGCKKLAKYLLENSDININEWNDEGQTLLQFSLIESHCSSFDRFAKIELCLQYGADANMRNKEGFTPLQWAITQDDLRILNEGCYELLLQNGAKIDHPYEVGAYEQLQGNTALILMFTTTCLPGIHLLTFRGSNNSRKK